MSMTKRDLELLPQAEQDAILGRHDEWVDDDENAPTFEDRVNEALHDWIQRGNPDVPIDWPEEDEPTDEELAEWARALMEEDNSPVDAEDEEPNDPLVKCRICRKTWPISEMNTNGECPDCQLGDDGILPPADKFTERENATFGKRTPKGKREGCFDI